MYDDFVLPLIHMCCYLADTRLMEELDDMQHQHMEERSRHAMVSAVRTV